MMERAKQWSKRMRVSEGNVACRLKRHSSESLHEFTTFNMDKTIRNMANEMCDSKLSGGIDLVAIEGKYHLSCLTNYRNCYCAFRI